MKMGLEAYLDSVGDCSVQTELARPAQEADCRLPIDELRQLGTDGASMSAKVPSGGRFDEAELDIAAKELAEPETDETSVPRGTHRLATGTDKPEVFPNTTEPVHQREDDKPILNPACDAHQPAVPVPGRRSLQYLNAGPDAPIEWVWDRVVPLRKLSLITGEPGCGKSLMVVDVIARVTQGMEEGETRSGGVMEMGGGRTRSLTLGARYGVTASFTPRLPVTINPSLPLSWDCGPVFI